MNPNFAFAGVEFGVQCFCGVEMDALSRKDDPVKKCSTPCGGSAAEMCGGGCALTMYRIDCGSAWGAAFLLALAACTLLYVAGGVGYNHKVKGVPLEQRRLLELLPNTAQWRSTYGLVVDGSVYSYAHARRAIDRARGLPQPGGYIR